jgi:hypothetical protein
MQPSLPPGVASSTPPQFEQVEICCDGVAFVRLPRGQDAAQISQFFVHVFGFKDRIAHDFA